VAPFWLLVALPGVFVPLYACRLLLPFQAFLPGRGHTIARKTLVFARRHALGKE
jgi:hypothetical protein